MKEAGDREQRKVIAGVRKERHATENRGRLPLGQGKRGRRQRTEEGHCWGREREEAGEQRTEEGYRWGREREAGDREQRKDTAGAGGGGRRQRTEKGHCWGTEREEAGDREQRKVIAGAGRERRQEAENRERLPLGQGKRGRRQRTEEGYCWGRKRE